MKRPNPFLVAVVSGVIGALAVLGTLSVTEEPNRAQECLYAAVSAYPSLPVTTSPLETLDVCKGLSGPQKQELRVMVNGFLESALIKSS